MEKTKSVPQAGLRNSGLVVEQPLPSPEHDVSKKIEQPTVVGVQPRLMSPQEEAKSAAEMELKRESALNRARFDPALLTQYRGELIAWNPDGTRIIAHAEDDETIYQMLDEVGENSALCLVQYVCDDTDVPAEDHRD